MWDDWRADFLRLSQTGIQGPTEPLYIPDLFGTQKFRTELTEEHGALPGLSPANA